MVHSVLVAMVVCAVLSAIGLLTRFAPLALVGFLVPILAFTLPIAWLVDTVSADAW